MAEETFPCHYEVPHPPHAWTPLVADPGDPQVVHMLGVVLPCPGRTAAEGFTPASFPRLDEPENDAGPG